MHLFQSLILTWQALQFDKAVCEALSQNVKSDAVIKGNLHTYRFCDNVWTFFVEDASITLSLGGKKETVLADKVKIVAVGAPT